jgi:hypothetical protein
VLSQNTWSKNANAQHPTHAQRYHSDYPLVTALSSPETAHKIDRAKLTQLIKQQSNLLQREMAQIMGVSATDIWHALKVMKIICKKRYATPRRSLQQARTSAKSTCYATGGHV